MHSGQRFRLAGTISLALSLTLSVALAACAPGSTRHGTVSTVSTPVTGAAPTKSATATGAPQAFVCANAPGSARSYAYANLNGPMYLTHGCSTPVAVQAEDGRRLVPIAFSPSGARLLAWDVLAHQTEPDTKSCLAVVDASSAQAMPTSICSPEGTDPTVTHWNSVIGWADDTNFYLADNTGGPVTVYLVSLPGLSRRLVTRLTWVADMVTDVATDYPSGIALRGDALYYGGYMDQSEGGAYLHRFSLTTGTDTRIVRLGLPLTGGCQVSQYPCGWTGPWDISRDGSHLTYHAPGPTTSLSDTDVAEPNTPLYIAESDGSGATRLFPSQPLGKGFNQAVFSPDGQYVVAYFPSATPGLRGSEVFERLTNGSTQTAPTELSWYEWSAQPGVAVMYNTQTSGAPDYLMQLELYNVATGARTPLQRGTYDYVWS